MTTDQSTQNQIHVGQTREVVFAGDRVTLAGQVDYPAVPAPSEGYPLLFILHHAGYENRDWYWPYAQIALECGYAAFRWDKRGTGRSGASGYGSTTQDAANAYETALDQPGVNRRRAVILAKGAGSAMLGTSYGLFARIQAPYGAILVCNMLDEQAVLALETRLRIVMGEHDWNPWQRYGEAACSVHNRSYHHGASFALIPEADRKLMRLDGEKPVLHPQAVETITHWLQTL